MTTKYIAYVIGIVVLWCLAMRSRSVKTRQVMYLVASYLFYLTWGSWLIVVLLFSSVMNYALGEWLKKKISAGRLWVGILFNLALLSFFKYLPLLGTVAHHGSPLLLVKRILFPAGVSFWTFQALSYLLELYREEELDPTLLEFCLYMSFWPTVLQGPICRMSAMLPQFRQDWSASAEDLRIGMRRIAIGIFMSSLAMVVGGGLYTGAGVEAVFSSTSSGAAAARLSGTDVWFMIFAYGFQLYFSFCGFTHIVIGGARLFGIQLQENFNRPYLSTTISEFWTRWHMSLSFWIRDFLFLPLATMRREVWWRNLSLVIAMFVFGVWHIRPDDPAAPLLMMWGIYHGILLVLHRQWQEFRKRMEFEWTGAVATVISWGVTFCAVSIGYIFFRAESMHQAFAMLKAITKLHSYRHLSFDPSFYVLTLLAAGGYFAAIGGTVLLDRLAEISRARAASKPGGLFGWLGILANERWVWITPVVVAFAIYLSVIFQPGHAETGPVMYALF
jgi:alginate O-acetyltransferase complex protein AlgI